MMFVSMVVVVTGCGGDDGGPGTPVDARRTIDAAVDASARCTVSTADFGDKGAMTGAATFSAYPPMPAEYSIVARTRLEPLEPRDQLNVELYSTWPPFGSDAAPGPVVPGTYSLTGVQRNLSTCGTCVWINTNDTSTTSGDGAYMATGGTLSITAVTGAVGTNFAYTLSDVTFEHVTIDSKTFLTTPVGDDCFTAIRNATFSTTLVPL